jgi:NCAIR mutase (PurE)-related protein
LDWNREARTGIAEAVLCDGKTPAQIAAILEEVEDRRLLLTRLSQEMVETLPSPHRTALDHDALSRTGFYGPFLTPDKDGPVVVCAGTSDLPVAQEAARCLIAPSA